MKQVNLLSLSLVNFRGHKELSVDFHKETTISGKNATGKSTIFDGFVWMLFGKDQFDRKDFEIIPTIKGKRLDRVDSEVAALINIDGIETTFRRVLHQKWTRRRGTADEVFDGCETLYYINDVPKKAGEYKSFVDTIADESVFKLITNPSAFFALHWTKQREFLFQIAGTVSDTEIANSNPVFASLLEMLNGKSLVDFKKELSARKKKLKDDLDNIQPRIDQTVKLMPQNKDFASLEGEINLIDDLIIGIELQISDKATAIRGQYDDIQEKQKKINSLKTKQQEVFNELQAKATQDSFTQTQSRRDLDNQIKLANESLSAEKSYIVEAERKLENQRIELDSKNTEVTKLRAEWTEESSKELTFSNNDFHCPTCKREFESGNVEAKKTELLANFKNDKAFKLSAINTKGLKLKGEIEGYNTVIANTEKLILDYSLLAENSKLSIASLTESLKEFHTIEPVKVIASELPEWQAIDKQIKANEATISEVKPVDNSELNAKKSELVTKRDELKNELSRKDLITKYSAEVIFLEKQGSELAQQIADAEKQEFTIDDFNRIKIEECDRRVNELFQIVRFQLFDKTNEGNEFEACIATNKLGVPIAATNTAERINAGIDIINSLSKFYNVAAPIFIDSAESVNDFIETEAQMVHLVVTREPLLTIK
jgi:DNA repair exonuclease SbcCD ATPase subunit